MNPSATESYSSYDANLRAAQLRELVERYQRTASQSARSWTKTNRRMERGLRTTREASYRLAKRLLDVVFSAILLLLSSPVLLLVACAIKLTDGGPVLYWQKRVGMWGAIFNFPKFRSMILNADNIVATLKQQNQHGNSITFKMKRDPRVTWIGRLIRRFSLDEFPQLWCVLTGQMTLVGPRPALPREVDLYSQEHRRRLSVRPGLTCIWQVSGRGDVPFDRQVQMDVEYVESHNFWLDVRLVISTVPAVILGRGAY